VCRADVNRYFECDARVHSECPQRGESQLPIMACIKGEIHLKNWLRCQWQTTMDTALEVEASDPPARVGERPLELQYWKALFRGTSHCG
jgi:hypothetical protein